VTQSLPASVKLSEDMSTFLKMSSSNPVTPSPVNSIYVASILHSVIEQLKSVTLINYKIHDKLNRLNMTASGSLLKSNAQSINFPIVVHHKSDIDTRSIQPVNQLIANLYSSIKSKFIVGSQKNTSSKLSSVLVRKHVDIFVSRPDPGVTTLLQSELFNGYSDVTIKKMVTRHPTYSSFHVRLPAEKLLVLSSILHSGPMV